MRKTLIRRYLVVDSPGGPCALELNAAAGPTITGATVEEWRGILSSAERFGASVSLSEADFGLLPV